MSTYEVYFISPRGFANEGDYVYGTPEQIAEEIDSLNENGRLFFVSTHRSKNTAMRAAAKHARRVRRESSPHVLCYVGIREAMQEQTQEDYNLVSFGRTH